MGTCQIQFRLDPSQIQDKNVITLHAKELCISSAQYVVVDMLSQEDPIPTTPVVAEEIILNTKATTVQFKFPQNIPPRAKTIQLTIQYMGYLNNQMAGFYRSEYTDIDGTTKKMMASTQFESLDARRCFPCMDEPAVKAIFSVQLTVDRHLDVLSNMPVAGQTTISSTTKCVTFMDTPIMSTYLLAICVGEFDVVQTRTTHGVMVSVYTPPGKSHMGRYALDTAAQALSAYDDFFQVPYPLPKLDMIAVPEFAMGAMEVRELHCIRKN
jgi:aminopeptidase N